MSTLNEPITKQSVHVSLLSFVYGYIMMIMTVSVVAQQLHVDRLNLKH